MQLLLTPIEQLWRVYVIWNTLWIVFFPFIMYLGSTGELQAKSCSRRPC